MPDFASYFFSSDFGTGIIAGRATPASDGKYNLNTATIDSLPVPVPALDEQCEVAAILNAIDRKIGPAPPEAGRAGGVVQGAAA